MHRNLLLQDYLSPIAVNSKELPDALATERVMLAAMREKAKNKDMARRVSERLKALRGPLLALHKALVDSERIEYEKVIGKIQSPNHFLQLLTNDPWFAWLSPLSQLIVSIDEALDDKEPPTTSAIEALLKETTRLLTPSETGSGFSKHYFDAIQRDPDVVLAHGAVVRSRHPSTS